MSVYAKRRWGLVLLLFALSFTMTLLVSGIYVWQAGVLGGVVLMILGLALVLTPLDTYEHREGVHGQT